MLHGKDCIKWLENLEATDHVEMGQAIAVKG